MTELAIKKASAIKGNKKSNTTEKARISPRSNHVMESCKVVTKHRVWIQESGARRDQTEKAAKGCRESSASVSRKF